MNARRGFRNVARHLSSMRNLRLAPKKETESFRSHRRAEKPDVCARAARGDGERAGHGTQGRERATLICVQSRRRAVPALLSLDKNPVVPDEKHVYALKKRKPTKAAGVREAVLAAAAVAGDDAVAAWPSARTARDDAEAFARAYDDNEFPDAPPEAVPAKVRGDERGTPSARRETATSGTTTGSRIPRWEGVRDDSDEKTTRTLATPATSGNASATDWRLPWRRTPRVSRGMRRRRALPASSRKQSTTCANSWRCASPAGTAAPASLASLVSGLSSEPRASRETRETRGRQHVCLLPLPPRRTFRFVPRRERSSTPSPPRARAR